MTKRKQTVNEKKKRVHGEKKTVNFGKKKGEKNVDDGSRSRFSSFTVFFSSDSCFLFTVDRSPDDLWPPDFYRVYFFHKLGVVRKDNVIFIWNLYFVSITIAKLHKTDPSVTSCDSLACIGKLL